MTPDAIDRAASDWFARLRAPDGETHRDAFEAWRAADPRHAQAYAEVERLWHAAASLRRPRPAARPSASPRRRPALAMAALAVVLALAIGLWRAGPLGPASDPAPPLVAFHADEAKALPLDDGSVVLLGPHATVAVAYSSAAREVRLTGGEARFLVAHDAARPFRVRAGDCTVLATGTVFDVRLDRGRTNVALLEGRVEVRLPHTRTVELRAGQGVGADGVPRAIAAQRAIPPRVSVEAMPLRDVVALANRGAAIPIELRDPTLADRGVTGTFDLADTRMLARKLAAALDLKLDERDDRLVLSAR